MIALLPHLGQARAPVAALILLSATTVLYPSYLSVGWHLINSVLILLPFYSTQQTCQRTQKKLRLSESGSDGTKSMQEVAISRQITTGIGFGDDKATKCSFVDMPLDILLEVRDHRLRMLFSGYDVQPYMHRSILTSGLRTLYASRALISFITVFCCPRARRQYGGCRGITSRDYQSDPLT